MIEIKTILKLKTSNSNSKIKKNLMQKINKIDKDHLEHYTCSICLEIFKEPLVITLCMHIFCKDCVDRYFDYFSKKFSIIELVKTLY